MPGIAKTIVRRIRRRLRERGLVKSLSRIYLLPRLLLRVYRYARGLRPGGSQSEFDCAHGVNTDGELGGVTYLSDLEIESPNWIEGNDYAAVDPEWFNHALASLHIEFEEYAFIDFGCGKGRALLMASEFPFKRIIGLEFSNELYRAAGENIHRYHSPTQKCMNIECLKIDFVDFVLPVEPAVLYFYDPCHMPVLEKVLMRTKQTLCANPRPTIIVFVNPTHEVEEVFSRADFLKVVSRSAEMNFVVYSNLL